MVVAAPIRRQEFDLVAALGAVARRDEGIIDIRHFFEGWIDRLQHFEGMLHALADVLRDAPELRKVGIVSADRCGRQPDAEHTRVALVGK